VSPPFERRALLDELVSKGIRLNYAVNNRIPYTGEYMLSIERGFGLQGVETRNIRLAPSI
jgi:hypothetical protein